MLLDALRGEHAVLRLLLTGVSRQIHEHKGRDLQAAFALLEDSLASHARIEDELLFDRLLTTHLGIASALEAMCEDHRAIRRELGALKGLPASAFRERYGRFSEQVFEHFAIEERVLFPLAATHVAAEELTRFGEEWARLRGVDLASGPEAQHS